MNPMPTGIGLVLGCGAVLMLGAAAVLTLIRMSRGPSTLDRVVAADVLIAILIAGLATEAVINKHATTLPVMLVLALIGFAGSLSIARFVADRDQARRWDTSRTPGRDGPRWVAPAEADQAVEPQARDVEDRGDAASAEPAPDPERGAS